MPRTVSTYIRFPSTDWGIISAVGRTGPGRRVALGELLVRYLPVLASYLQVRWRISPDRADDLLQGFVAAKVLEQDLVARADRNKGRFRDLLVTTLDRYVVSEFRKAAAGQPASGNPASLDAA